MELVTLQPMLVLPFCSHCFLYWVVWRPVKCKHKAQQTQTDCYYLQDEQEFKYEKSLKKYWSIWSGNQYTRTWLLLSREYWEPNTCLLSKFNKSQLKRRKENMYLISSFWPGVFQLILIILVGLWSWAKNLWNNFFE